MKPVIVVHHHEIILKGENRKYFERQLMKNVRLSLRDLIPPQAVRGGYGRSVIELEPGSISGEAEHRLGAVFGLSNICSGVRVEQEIDTICTPPPKILAGRQFLTIPAVTPTTHHTFSLSSLPL